jgi:hypothetical protein
MRIYSYRDIPDLTSLLYYIRDLRTGITPVYSVMEIVSWLWLEDIGWITGPLFRLGMAIVLILPFAFTTGFPWWVRMIHLTLATICVQAFGLIYALGNAQPYDVMTPLFLLGHMLLLRLASAHKQARVGALFSIISGILLSLSELSRPFMLAIMPVLLSWALLQYWRNNTLRRLGWFLLPVVLLSGGWHLKLLLYNDGQIIWSNHGGCNLLNAWAPLVDIPSLEATLEPEAPPLNNYGWAWQNLNTDVHSRNCKRCSQAVTAAIVAHPGRAAAHFFSKLLIFLNPRTQMYDNDPTGGWIIAYRWVVRGGYAAALLLGGWLLTQMMRRRRSFDQVWMLLYILLGFLTLMPVIGESGEEARFMVSVVPVLLACCWRSLSLIFSPDHGYH